MSSAADQYRMLQMMRWFGPDDPVSLSDIRQAGCSGVVTALHHIANGEIWPIEDIKRRKEQIGRAGMAWSVVESLPVHEDIKTRSGRFQELISSYKTSLRHLAACGIRTVTYNFMPILDWTRTDVQYELEDGSRTLRFERAAFVAFDVYMLQRENAESDYLPEEIENARKRLASMSDAEKLILQQTILAGLPGSEQSYSLEKFRNTLRTYDGVNAVQLRRHLILFLQEIIPEAETLGMQMVIHPDDPPYPILKLPRVVSTYDDLQHIFNAVPSLSNGLCLCTGSLGVRADNDLLKIANTFSDRINFLHLRSTRRNEQGDFYEDNHLEGDVDMYAVLDAVVGIMRRRKTSIPMRPDHGHQMLDDLNKKTNPGYSAIGRLRGLAELRGLEWGILQSSKNSS